MTKSLVVNCRRNSLSLYVTRKRFGERFVSFMVKREEHRKTIHPVKSTDESKTFNNIVYVSRINNRRFIGTAHKLFVGLTLRVIGYWRLSVDCFHIPRWAIFKRRYVRWHPAKTFRSLCLHTCPPTYSYFFCYCFRSTAGLRGRPPIRRVRPSVDRDRKRLPTSTVLARLVLNKTRALPEMPVVEEIARHRPRRETNGVTVVCTNLEPREHPHSRIRPRIYNHDE